MKETEKREQAVSSRSSITSYDEVNVGQNNRKLLAIAVGIEQKRSVDSIVTKFIPENFTVILFHYDGNVNDWQDCSWSSAAIHITAHSQTKWWFAKRFLHPDVVSIYDYIFLWDEDLGVENFHPGRYLDIVKSEGLEISQPALDPNLSEIHHQITVRRKKGKVHRRVWDRHSGKCSHDSKEPPCIGWVEGMAPVFSRSAWRCVWNLIQGDKECSPVLSEGRWVEGCVQGCREEQPLLNSERVQRRGESAEKSWRRGSDDVVRERSGRSWTPLARDREEEWN
ncbi:hypothetical protein KSP40_PGU004159 [Platanthera guangdongensis]|uniref:Uncharacterized protein n=1 Tax=Platanthera guangdongensis TaxID=2320717 RepID=A0ABR2MAZ9_9ASPA